MEKRIKIWKGFCNKCKQENLFRIEKEDDTPQTYAVKCQICGNLFQIHLNGIKVSFSSGIGGFGKSWSKPKSL